MDDNSECSPKPKPEHDILNYPHREYESSVESETAACSERTLAIIKPEAYQFAETIENIILKQGFAILAKRHVLLTPEQAAEFYYTHYGHQHFPHLVAQMSAGPIVAMVLACRNAINRWKRVMGPAKVIEAQAYWPDSIRASFGKRTPYGEYFNGAHGSDNLLDAHREIHFFFPNMVVGPILRQWQVQEYIQMYIAPALTKGLEELSRLKPEEPILWLSDWLAQNNPNKPQIEEPLPQMRDAPDAVLCEPSEESETDSS